MARKNLNDVSRGGKRKEYKSAKKDRAPMVGSQRSKRTITPRQGASSQGARIRRPGNTDRWARRQALAERSRIGAPPSEQPLAYEPQANWTTQDVALLKQLVMQKKSMRTMEAELGKSPAAIIEQARREGLPLKAPIRTVRQRRDNRSGRFPVNE